jgi:hypothetical protein
MIRFLGNLLVAAWLRAGLALTRLRAAYLRRRLARVDRRLREHGIDPDAIPEVVEMRRRHSQER